MDDGRRLLLLCAGLAALTVYASCVVEAGGDESDTWTDLFNGRDLEGWYVVGDGRFYVNDGVIVGETVLGTRNSFLVTDEEYDDFELLVEFRIGSAINSGVQIRSAVYEEETTTRLLTGQLEWQERTWPPGRVYGLQVEIDPSERGWTAGIYEEGRRGWLAPITDNEPAREAFRPGEWNQLRTVASGRSIRTWINGVSAAELEDSDATSGFIALQLHGASRPEQEGQTIEFRNVIVRSLSE